MSNEISQENMPYTVVGHSGIPRPEISILLTAEGIKELAKRMEIGDMCRITRWSDFSNKCQSEKYFGDITIIKKDNEHK